MIRVVGVNGSGKTTTAAKLAKRLALAGGRPLLAAADTFRAAATEQLERWAERVAVPVVTGKPGGDPAAVVFDAIASATARGHSVVIADTAGRLHTKEHLMDELGKIVRVAGRAREGAPDPQIFQFLGSKSGINKNGVIALGAQAVSFVPDRNFVIRKRLGGGEARAVNLAEIVSADEVGRIAVKLKNESINIRPAFEIVFIGAELHLGYDTV